MLYEIFKNNDVESMKKHINRHNINNYYQGTAHEIEKVTPLHIAMDLNSVKGVEYLLANGADPNQDCGIFLQKDGTTSPSEFAHPLVHATLCCDYATIFGKMLIEAGANKNVRTKNGKTAKYYAQMYRHQELVELLSSNPEYYEPPNKN